MAAATSNKVLSLYKIMLRESGKFVDFNYRSYAIRRIKDGFRDNSKEMDKTKVEENIKHAEENLKLIQRQATIGHLFGLQQKIAIELRRGPT